MLSYRFITKFLWLVLIVGWFVQALPTSHSIVEKIRAGDIPDLGVVDPKQLKQMAEVDGYGYKTTNLEELKKLAKKLNTVLKQAQSHYSIGVPEFVGIASSTVKSFLKSQDVDIAVLWTKLMDKYFSAGQRNKNNPIFQTKNFPDGFLQAVKSELVEPIAAAFEKTKGAAKEKIDKNILELPEDKKNALDELISSASKSSKRLMVRSTGKEDTDKLANAGGNETKANVIPDWSNVIEAIKEVIISYFGEKSLIQRLGAGDETLFEEPMTPFLVQLMIGEKPGGQDELQKIPRCGVMFTEEPEGGLSKMNPDDKSKTSGITIIQASYGHNEGVVNSIVPVDTYYVDMFGDIFPVIRPKFFRLIPSKESGKLERSALHPKTWSYVPALNDEEISVLKLLANALEQYYQGPMDVEYVIDRSDKKPTVWIVQARPIVHNPNQPKPSYLKDPNVPNKISCEAIGVAGGKLRVVENDKQCIVRKTIGEALEAYQDAKTDRTKVECIIVGQHAPETSHEATTFRSELKPVVFANDWEKVESWVKEQKKVIVDVQQGIIAPWEYSDKALSNALIEGWVSYPIPAKMSLWPRNVAPKKLLQLVKFIADKQIKLDEDLGKQFGLIGQNLAFMDDCFQQLDKEELKEKTFQQPTRPGKIQNPQALSNVLKKQVPTAILQQNLIQLKDGLVQLKYKMTQLADKLEFLKNRMTAVHQITAPINQERKDKHVLLYKQFERAVKTQQVALGLVGEIVNGYSLATLFKELKADVQAKQSLVPEIPTTHDERLEQFIKLKDVALVKELGTMWSDFVNKKVANAPDQQREQFSQLIHTLGELDTLDLWLHTIFANAASAKDCTVQTVLAVSWDGATQNFLKELAEKKKILKQTNLSAVADPNKFEKVWNDFCENMVAYFTTTFVDGFLQTTDTGRLAALQVMNDFVSVFDNALKDMSRSNAYNIFTGKPSSTQTDRIKKDKDKGFVFKLMLQKNLEVLKKWWDLYSKIDIDKEAKTHVTYENNVGVDYALTSVDKLLQSASLGQVATDFQSGEYQVGESVIGSSVNWDRSKPKSLENIFTWIHQSQLAIVGFLNKLIGLDPTKSNTIPPQLKTINVLLKKELPEVSLLGSSLKNGILTLFYNWPQRNHSASIIVSYMSATKNVEITLGFVGINEYGRWDVIADVLSIKSNCTCRTNLFPHGVEAIWSMKDGDIENEINGIIKLMKTASDITFIHSMDQTITPTIYASLNKPLKFWADYENCGRMFSHKQPLELSEADIPDIKKIIARLLDDKKYQTRSTQLMEHLSSLDDPEVTDREIQTPKISFIENLGKMMAFLFSKNALQQAVLEQMLDNINAQESVLFKDSAPGLWRVLIKEEVITDDKHIDQAIQVAVNTTGLGTLYLYEVLIEKGLIKEEKRIDQAIQVAGNLGDSLKNSGAARQLWNALIEKGLIKEERHIDQAIQAAGKLSNPLEAVNIWRALIEKGLIKEEKRIDQAIQTAANFPATDSGCAMGLWKALIEKGLIKEEKHIDQAIQTAMNFPAKDSFSKVELWRALIEKGLIKEEKRIDQAIQTAANFPATDSGCAMDLWKALIEKGLIKEEKHIDQAIQTAMNFPAKDSFSKVELWKALIEKGLIKEEKRIDQAIQTAMNFPAKDSFSKVELWKALIEKGLIKEEKHIDQAIQTAMNFPAKDSFSKVELWKALIEKGLIKEEKRIDQAIQTAMNFPAKDSFSKVELWKALIEKKWDEIKNNEQWLSLAREAAERFTEIEELLSAK